MIDVRLRSQEISNLSFTRTSGQELCVLLPSWSGTNERESKEAAASPDLPSHHMAPILALVVPHVAQGHVGKDVLGYFCRHFILALGLVLFTVWDIWKELL